LKRNKKEPAKAGLGLAVFGGAGYQLKERIDETAYEKCNTHVVNDFSHTLVHALDTAAALHTTHYARYTLVLLLHQRNKSNKHNADGNM
jgi:hypothetical protein